VVDELNALDRADNELLFSGVERLRFIEKYNLKDQRPMKHKVLEDSSFEPIKNVVRASVISIRTGTAG
jgi:hypothetical protein